MNDTLQPSQAPLGSEPFTWTIGTGMVLAHPPGQPHLAMHMKPWLVQRLGWEHAVPTPGPVER